MNSGNGRNGRLNITAIVQAICVAAILGGFAIAWQMNERVATLEAGSPWFREELRRLSKSVTTLTTAVTQLRIELSRRQTLPLPESPLPESPLP